VAVVVIGPGRADAAGSQSSYLVLASDGSSTAQAAQRVTAAGGQIVAAYDQIGVLVVRSAKTSFAKTVSGHGVLAAVTTKGFGTVLADDGVLATVDAATVAAQTHAAGRATDEPLFGLQWNMTQIDVPAAQKVTRGKPSIVVGVLDSGISSTHPDLATQIAKDKSASCLGGVVDTRQSAWSPTASTHGTHVAGIIAAAINGVGVAGVAPGVKVASVKVVDDNGFIYPEAAICGFLWAADHGMQITNNSYFIDPWQFNCRNDPRQRPIWEAVQRALRYSARKGVLNIAAAGNDNYDLAHTLVDSISPDDGSGPVEDRVITNSCLELPAEAPGVVAVSALGIERRKAAYSSYGLGVIDVAAPGGDIHQPDPTAPNIANAVLSTIYDPGTGENGWGYEQGTSMATPHVAGVAALALSANPHLTPGALASLLQRTAEALPCPPGVYDPIPQVPAARATCDGGRGHNGFYGAGEVDALAIVT
jgi:subtilisin family serine protease